MQEDISYTMDGGKLDRHVEIETCDTCWENSWKTRKTTRTKRMIEVVVLEVELVVR